MANNNRIEAAKLKIKKLFEKANSAKEIGSIQEAITFSDKVNQLLQNYNLSLSEVITAEEIKIQQLEGPDRIEYGKNPIEGLWEIDLIDALAKYNFCKALFRTYRNVQSNIYPSATIIGTSENIEVVKWLIDIIRNQLSILAPIEFVKN